MTLLRFAGAGRDIGGRWVLRDVSFHVGARDRWGIVGRNGAGKTTLLRLATGADLPTEGDVWRHPSTRIDLLRQSDGSHVPDSHDGMQTVREAALAAFSALRELERRLEAEEAALADARGAEAERLLRRYDHHLEQFRRRGGYEMEARAEAALDGLGFPSSRWGTTLSTLSGGELSRLRLVQTLLGGPDVLLLDEPTNHLDLRSTEWLEGFLRDFVGAVLVVTHDRAFLRKLADHVLHVESGTAVPYIGGYDAFLTQRDERRLVRQREFDKQQEHVARTEDFIRRNLAGQKTRQAQSRRAQLARLDRVDAPTGDDRAMGLRFGESARSGGIVLRLESVTHRFSERPLFAPFSAEVTRGERVAIVGPNGCGKSTLMRALGGDLRPAGGEVIPGVGVRIGYYRQSLAHLDPSLTVWEQAGRAAPSLPMPDLRKHLARFLFTGDEIEARIGDLSGGEQARVALAGVVLERPNLLLLDEPTNHLDIESREALEAALRNFDGTTIVISHDRALLSAVADRVWAFSEDERGIPFIEDFGGTFAEWIERRETGTASVQRERARAASPKTGWGGEAAGEGGLSKNEIRRRKREIARLEENIHRLEEEVAETEQRLADPTLYVPGADPERARAIVSRRDAARAELEELYLAWERVGEELATA